MASCAIVGGRGSTWKALTTTTATTPPAGPIHAVPTQACPGRIDQRRPLSHFRSEGLLSESGVAFSAISATPCRVGPEKVGPRSWSQGVPQVTEPNGAVRPPQADYPPRLSPVNQALSALGKKVGDSVGDPSLRQEARHVWHHQRLGRPPGARRDNFPVAGGHHAGDVVGTGG